MNWYKKIKLAKVPALTQREFVKKLRNLGFYWNSKKSKGSHQFYQHPDGRFTGLPAHAGKTINPYLAKKIIENQLNMTVEQFQMA